MSWHVIVGPKGRQRLLSRSYSTWQKAIKASYRYPSGYVVQKRRVLRRKVKHRRSR